MGNSGVSQLCITAIQKLYYGCSSVVKMVMKLLENISDEGFKARIDDL